MKKNLWMITIFGVLLLLAACGKNDNATESTDNQKETTEAVSEETNTDETSDEEPTNEETMVEEASSLKVLNNDQTGEYLADSNGMALYYFTKDEKEKSNCSGECLEKWPPFTEKQFEVPEGFSKEDFGTITREDNNEEQVTYKGYPLYYFAGDKQEGDVKGQGVKEVWYIVNKDTDFQ